MFMSSGGGGGLVGYQVFEASGIYTPSAGVETVETFVTCAGAKMTSANGGGAGGTSIHVINLKDEGVTSATITVVHHLARLADRRLGMMMGPAQPSFHAVAISRLGARAAHQKWLLSRAARAAQKAATGLMTGRRARHSGADLGLVAKVLKLEIQVSLW